MPTSAPFNPDLFRELSGYARVARNSPTASIFMDDVEDRPLTTKKPGNKTLFEMGYGSEVKEYTPSDKFFHNFHVGIELEIEGTPSSEGFPRSFEMVSDNSLRQGGVEVRSRKGLCGKALETSVNRLTKWLESSGYTLSERCSTHIHLNVGDMSPRQVVNLLCLSTMLEPLMFRLFGNKRRANFFCMATDMGTHNYGQLVEAIDSPMNVVDGQWSKYAAIGLNRIRDLGTVEYRMFQPILTEEDYLRVINFLFAMKNEAMNMETPNSIIDYKLSSTMQDLFQHYFPEMQYLEEFDALLERGVQTLNDILLSSAVVGIVKERSESTRVLIDEARRQLDELQRGI